MDQVPPLPRALDPNRFAAVREPEITSLCEAVKSLLGDTYGVDGLPRQLRRRTRSHNSYSHRRRPNAKLEAERQQEKSVTAGAEGQHPVTSATNRAMRRRPGRLQAQFVESARWTEAALAEESAGARQLETHLWHAKRTTMAPCWGWVLPEGEPGKGQGSRAFARRVSSGAVVHDASYWCPLLLAGPVHAVHAVLQQVQDPAQAADIVACCAGSRCYEVLAILHRQGQFPCGAIGPVQVQRLPQQALPAAAVGDGDLCLCLWVHAAAAAEAHQELSACAAQVPRAELSVVDLRRVELRGSRASEALASVLSVQGVAGERGAQLTAALTDLEPGEVAHLVLLDPRLTKPLGLGDDVAREAGGGMFGAPAVPPACLLLQPNLPAPLSEAALSSRRQELRRRALGIDAPFEEVGPAVEVPEGGATHFPAIYVRQEATHAAHSGWSVIVPPGWVPPLWLSLVFANCRPAGQREWRWLHTLQGVPFFPHDAPDTRAYASFMEQAAAELQQAEARRPKGKRLPSTQAHTSWRTLADLTAPAEAEAPLETPASPSGGEEASFYVARSEAAVAAALWGAAGVERVVGQTPAARPVANALASGSLVWRPRAPPASGSRLCGVEVLLQVVKRGVAAPGAEVCVISGREAERPTQPCYLRTSSAQEAEQSQQLQAPEWQRVVDPGDVQTIGYVCSAAPHGMPRTAPSLAVCSAAAVWRLRSLQHYAPRRDRGAVQAWMRNPGSTALFPVRLSLRMEQA